MMEKDLEKARQIFLTDVDEETRGDNAKRLLEWEQSLIKNSAYLKWQQQDITQNILQEVKSAYQDASVQLALTRDLTEIQRNKLYATQDACMFIIGIMAKDAKSTLEQLQKEIRFAVRAVS